MRLIGYLISLLGLIVLALSVDVVKAMFNLTSLTISKNYLMILGGILIFIGILIIISSGRGKGKRGLDLPIYQGRNIIGYRRK